MIKGKNIAVRPNTLIEARYSLTPKQNDILDMVLTQVGNDENYLYEINVEEFKENYKFDSSNIYRDLKRAVREFEGKGFKLIDTEQNKEIFFVWFSSIAYLNNEGKIIVEVGKQLKKLLVEMKKRIFYKIEYPLNFSSIYSKRIYYYLKSFEDTNWRIDKLDELRIKLQCPKSYEKFGLFRKNVLEQAQKEINNFSDIIFEFKEIKKGRKVTYIKFIIHNKKKTANKNIESSKINSELYIEKIKNIFTENITDKDATTLYEISNKNIELIKEKYSLTKNKNISNIIGFMIKALQENYTSINNENDSIWNYENQRNYDYDELERKLLKIYEEE